MDANEQIILDGIRKAATKLGYKNLPFTVEIITNLTLKYTKKFSDKEVSLAIFENWCQKKVLEQCELIKQKNQGEIPEIYLIKKPKKPKKITVNEIAGDLEEVCDEKELIKTVYLKNQYSTKDFYYLKDFYAEIENQLFEGENEDDAMTKARDLYLPSLRRVLRVVRLTKETIYVKNTLEDPFMPLNIDKQGYYGSTRPGEFKIKIRNAKGEFVTKRKGPFSLLHGNSDLVSYSVINQPYHADEGHTDLDKFNIFSGFKATLNEENNNASLEELLSICNPLLKHLKDVIANGNEEHYKYMLEWFFYPIRELLRTNLMLVIYGFQGVGKTLIFNFLRDYVYGEDLLAQPSGLHSITEHFNAILNNKMIICVDETQAQGEDHKDALKRNEEMKALITGDKYQLTKKFTDSGMVNNNISFACTTNTYIGCLQLREDQRRVGMFETMDEKTFNAYVGVTKEDLELEPDKLRSEIFRKRKIYFDKLCGSFNQKMGDTFYVLARTYPKLKDGLSNIPLTDILKENIEASRAKGNIFFTDIINGIHLLEVTRLVKGGKIIETKVNGQIKKEDNRTIYITIGNLFSEYESWWKKTKNGRVWGMDYFSKQLKNIDYITIHLNKRINCTKTTWIEFNRKNWNNIQVGRDDCSEGSMNKFVTEENDDSSSTEEVNTPTKTKTIETITKITRKKITINT